MIEIMLDDDIADIRREVNENKYMSLTKEILNYGWKGYLNLTDEEVEIEYQNRVKCGMINE